MEVLAVLFVLALVAGWFLGVIGFFKVLSARAEIAALRRAIEALSVGQPAPVASEPRPASVPYVAPPETVEQAVPEPAAVAAEPPDIAPPARIDRRPRDIEALLERIELVQVAP